MDGHDTDEGIHRTVSIAACTLCKVDLNAGRRFPIDDRTETAEKLKGVIACTTMDVSIPKNDGVVALTSINGADVGVQFPLIDYLTSIRCAIFHDVPLDIIRR